MLPRRELPHEYAQWNRAGYEEFSTDRILSRLEEFAIGTGYPQLAELVSFRAPGELTSPSTPR